MSEDVVTVLNRRIIELETERDALQAKLDKVLEENADLRAEFMDVLNTIGEDDVQD